MDRLERQLSGAFDQVRDWTPDARGRFAEVERLARRRALRHRAVAGGGVALMVVTVLGLTLVARQEGRGDPVSVAAGPAKRSSVSTETAPTTSTTLPPSTSGPPDAFASGPSGSVAPAKGSTCWSEDGRAFCADVGPGFGNDAPLLTVKASEAVTFEWRTDEQPHEVRAYVWLRGEGPENQREVRCEGANPCRLVADVAPGDYVVTVSTRWPRGGVVHAVRLQVR